MACLQGFEPRTRGLEGRCSIQLSYERILEQKTRFELATLALARRCSTTEPLLHDGGGGRIRTFEVTDCGFTVRPLWPLGNPTRYGANNGTRTRNLLITSQLLYQLSYVGKLYLLIMFLTHHQILNWRPGRDSNPRPPA